MTCLTGYLTVCLSHCWFNKLIFSVHIIGNRALTNDAWFFRNDDGLGKESWGSAVHNGWRSVEKSSLIIFGRGGGGGGSLLTMAFCLKDKAMVMRSPVSSGDVSNLRGWVRTDKNIQVCKSYNWSRVVDCLMTVSWLSHDCWKLIAEDWLLEIDY